MVNVFLNNNLIILFDFFNKKYIKFIILYNINGIYSDIIPKSQNISQNMSVSKYFIPISKLKWVP